MIYRIDFKAMGCKMVAMVDSSSPQAPEQLAQVPNWFEEWEQTLSRFRTDSELNRLNRSAGWPVKVSQVLWDVFQAAEESEINSSGLVTSTVLDAMLHSGYDRSFDQMPNDIFHSPSNVWNSGATPKIKVTLSPKVMGCLSLGEVSKEESSRTICLPADIHLDFGGVAKGWSAGQAANRLSEFGPALVSAGGDIAITAEQTLEGLWPVTINDPFHRDEIIASLLLGACGVATSGTDHRRWKQGGRWNHHIIDPRTGFPAQTDLITATVIAPDVLQAEMAAKVAVILGSQRGMEWIEARPELSTLLILETGEIIQSNHSEQFFGGTYEYENARSS